MSVDVKRIEAVLNELRWEDLPVAVRSWRVEDTENWAGDPPAQAVLRRSVSRARYTTG